MGDAFRHASRSMAEGKAVYDTVDTRGMWA